MKRLMIVGVAICSLAISDELAAAAEGGKPVAEPSPRVTPVVKLVQKCLPSVVAIRTVRQVEPGKFVFGAGSGAVIHQEPIATGTAERPSTAYHKPGGDFFGLKFTGMVDVPANGLYIFYTRSDDGSRLYIDDKLVVDNDGLHGAAESGGLVRLKAGLHPFVVTFFEASGQEMLDVAWEGPGIKKQQIPPAAYFHRNELTATDDREDGETEK